MLLLVNWIQLNQPYSETTFDWNAVKYQSFAIVLSESHEVNSHLSNTFATSSIFHLNVFIHANLRPFFTANINLEDIQVIGNTQRQVPWSNASVQPLFSTSLQGESPIESSYQFKLTIQFLRSETYQYSYILWSCQSLYWSLPICVQSNQVHFSASQKFLRIGNIFTCNSILATSSQLSKYQFSQLIDSQITSLNSNILSTVNLTLISFHQS